MTYNNKTSLVLFCRCSYSNIIPDEIKQEVQTILKKSHLNVIAVPDLCGMAAHHDPELANLVTNSEPLKIVACYPRAVRWLFYTAGATLSENNVEFLNMRAQSIKEIKTALLDNKQDPENFAFSMFEKNGEWIPWFPIIDYDRCKSCKQCASFCIFGVYHISENGKVIVKNPQNCKNNCPACARICPDAAIMFPKIGESPINGDVITDEEMVKAKIKLNVDEILGDDIYAALAERRRKAKQLRLRKKALQQAHNEREKCAASKN